MQAGLITRILRGDWLHVINDYIDYICNRHPCRAGAVVLGVRWKRQVGALLKVMGGVEQILSRNSIWVATSFDNFVVETSLFGCV